MKKNAAKNRCLNRRETLLLSVQLVFVFSNLNIIFAENCAVGQTGELQNTYDGGQQYMKCYSTYKDFYAVENTWGYNEETQAGCQNACNLQYDGWNCAGYTFNSDYFGYVVCGLCLASPSLPLSYSTPQQTTSYLYAVTGNTTICFACEAGKYKASTGSAACTDCPANTDSPAESDQETDCTCVAPFSGPGGGPCSCAAGSAAITKQNYDSGLNDNTCRNILDSLSSVTLEQCQLACDIWTPTYDWQDLTCQAFAHSASWETCRLCSDRSTRGYGGYTMYLTTNPLTTYIDCALCPVNTYSTDGTSCENCPANTYSESIGSTSSTTCVCGVGFTGTATCTQCVNGKYKSLIGSAACSNCNSGYVSNDDYSDCNACDAGKYEENDECLLCAAIDVNSYSAAGSTACLCNAGSSGPDHGSCTLCQAGKYKNTPGSSACVECQNYKVALTTGRTICQSCVAGKYFTSTTLCTDCHEHSTSSSGAEKIGDCYCNSNYYKSSSSTCSECPDFSTSAIASDDADDCSCNAGYEKNIGTQLSSCGQCLPGTYKLSAGNFFCEFCPVGTYSSNVAATECTNCAAGKYSSEFGATICTDCPSFSTSDANSDALDDCKCDAGYSGYAQNCQACAVGKYKSTTGSQTCTDCAASKTSTSTANVDENSCFCDVGFGLNLEQNCVACEPGKYKLAQDNSGCLPCSIAKYQDEIGQSACKDCIDYSTTTVTGSALASNCLCNSGYTYANSACNLCVDGLFKDTVSNEPCEECEDGHDSATNRQFCFPCNFNQYLFDQDAVHNCVNCPTNSKSDQASVGVFACSCDEGYGRVSADNCEACALGFTKPTAGNELCAQCTAGTFINYLASTACLTCHNYSYSTEASSKCSCNTGYVEESVDGSIACIPCPAGKIATEASLTVCEDCAPGQFNSQQAATVCSQCGANSVTLQSASTSESQCLCNAGYTKDANGVCVACAANFYKSIVSDFNCTNCPENTFSESGTISILDCGCNAGYTKKVVVNVSSCEACEAGKYKVHIGSGDCFNCENGKYLADTGKTSANDCVACPLNSITLLDASVSVQSCICNPGYIKFNLSNISSEFECNACEIGKYSELSFTACERCVGNTTTLQIGTDSRDNCVCNTGYAFNSDFDSGTNEKCVACQAGKYKPLVADSQCSDCGIGKYSNKIGQTNELNCELCLDSSQTILDGATSIGECLCNAGYTYVLQQINSSVFARCEPCATNTFKAQLGNTVCESCAYNAFSEVGSIRCTCNDGFYVPGISATEPNGEDCILNPYMHYIFSSNGQLDDKKSCKIQCEHGYYRSNNRDGLKCRAHTYSQTHECPENHFLIPGSYFADSDCRLCKLCNGKQVMHECNRSHDTVCVDCVEDQSIGFLLQDTGFLPAFARFVNAHNEPCKLGCLNGLVLNKATKQCEVCLDVCRPGYFFPKNRQNCTHCEKCALILPNNAQYVTSEDRVDCEWICMHGFQLEHGECVKTIHSSSIEETNLGSEFDDASICSGDCHEPGCIIHEAECKSCFELPEDHPIIKTLSTPENELKKNFANSNPLLVDSKPPHGKHRWIFTGSSCAWQCLIGWSKIRSDDLSHFKCEPTIVVNHLLRTTNQKNNFASIEVESSVQEDVIIMNPSLAAQNNSQKNVTIITVSDDSVLITGLVVFALPVLFIIILVSTKLILLCSNK